MIATISLRFREQDAITVIMGRFKEEGWTYDGFIPGPEYTIKAENSSFAIGSQIFQIGNIEKDQWFLLIFSNESAQRIPDDLRNIQLGGKADAFFKANRPVYLASRIRVYPNGEGSDVVIDPLVSIRQEGRELSVRLKRASIRQEGRELGERLKSGEITKEEFEHEKKMILKKYGL